MALHFADNFDYTGTIIFFGTFHLMQVLILLNLMSGLIWEVFTIVPSDEILEEVNQAELTQDSRSPKRKDSARSIGGSPLKSRKSKKNLLLDIEDINGQKPIARGSHVKEMDEIPEVSGTEESSSESSSSQAHSAIIPGGTNSIYIYIYIL